MRKTIFAFTLMLLGLSTNAYSENENYFSVGYGVLKYKEPSLEIGGISALSLSIGHMFTQNWGVEGRYLLGMNEGKKTTTIKSNAYRIKIKLDYYMALLGVANLPVTEKFNVFAKAGFANISRSGSATVISTGRSVDIASVSGNSFTFFAGLNYALADQYLVEFNVGSYYDRNDISSTGFELALKKTF